MKYDIQTDSRKNKFYHSKHILVYHLSVEYDKYKLALLNGVNSIKY